jgi:MSHA pilin protein MshD
MKPASSLTSKKLAFRRGEPRQGRGFTLIDVLVLITLLGIVAGAVTALFMNMAKQSAEVMRTRQVISVAQSLLNEIEMMPFTNCDPNISVSGCGPTAEAMGPEAGEVRYHTVATTLNTRFDNVNDYNGFTEPNVRCAGICDIQGTVLNPAGSTLEGCTSAVTVAPQAMTGIANTEGLLITVTITCPGITRLTLQGVRTRYALTTH